MNSKLKSVIIFLVFLLFNFGALAIGALFTKEGATSSWYYNLNRAPWEPPGWFFGVAWTTIMLLFSIYMTKAWNLIENKKILVLLYGLQLILNIIWNPIFFHYHFVLFGLIVITSLTHLIGYILFKYKKDIKYFSLLLLPYFMWLIVATSLNAFILVMN